MHEASLIQSMFGLLETYGREYRLKKVTRVVLHVGELAGVCNDSLLFAFEAIRDGTIAEHAEFVIETIPAVFRCISCRYEFRPQQTNENCPVCSCSAMLITGKELNLQTLEGDQEGE